MSHAHTQRAYCCFVDCIWLSFWPFLCFRSAPLSAYECTKGRWKLSMASAFVGIKGEMLACAAFASAIPWHPGGWVHSYRSNKAKVTPHNGRLPNKIECPLTQISQKVLSLMQQSIGLQVEAYSTASQSDFNMESWFSGMLVNDVDSKGCHDVQMVDRSSLTDNSTFSRIGLWFTGSPAENTAQLSAQGFIFVSWLDQAAIRSVSDLSTNGNGKYSAPQASNPRVPVVELKGLSNWLRGRFGWQRPAALESWNLSAMSVKWTKATFSHHACRTMLKKSFFHRKGITAGGASWARWVVWRILVRVCWPSECAGAWTLARYVNSPQFIHKDTYKQTQIAHVQGIASRIESHGEPTDDHINVECRYCCV